MALHIATISTRRRKYGAKLLRPDNEAELLMRPAMWKLSFILGLIVLPALVSGCTTTGSTGDKAAASHVKTLKGKKVFAYTARDRECLERAMYFEANRSSQDGLIAVGTVVMNRLANERYPNTICGVVGQKNQFAPGVLTRKMKTLPDVQAAADAVLKGKRHPALKNSMFFHTAGLKFPYRNMHYVLVAGGNSFYEKRKRDGSLENPVPQTPMQMAFVSTSGEKERVAPEMKPATETVQIALAEKPQGQEPVQGKSGQDLQQLALVAVKPADKPKAEQFETYESAKLHKTSANESSSEMLGYGAERKHVDEIGALLLAQDRSTHPL